MSIDRGTPPQPSDPRPYHFPHITRATLPNGLRVLVTENHNAPLVSLRALIRSGADHDTVKTAGLASLTAEILDEGAGSRDAIQLAEAVGLLGGALGTGADWDASYVSLDVLSRNAEAAAGIFADVTARATLPEDGLERARAERLNEILQQRDEPATIAGKRFANLLYGTGTYGNSVLGNAESVESIALEGIRRFYAQHYIPNNSAVVISGDLAPERAVELAQAVFGDWKRGEEPPRPTVTPRAVDRATIYVIDRPQAVQ